MLTLSTRCITVFTTKIECGEYAIGVQLAVLPGQVYIEQQQFRKLPTLNQCVVHFFYFFHHQ